MESRLSPKNLHLKIMIKIKNKLEDIESTNFGESPLADLGMVGVSLNAGCLRLLIPQSVENQIPDMLKSCDYAIVSTIENPSSSGLCMEVVFEDHSAAPFCLVVSEPLVLGFIPAPDQTRIERKLTLWTKGPKKVATLKAFSRSAPSLPWLKPL